MAIMTRMQKARSRMLLKHPFFATLVMSSPMVETRDIPTAATDMVTLFYNPDFIDSLPEDEHVLFVLAHEVMHVALEHGLRLRGRNHRLWNIACDFALNLVLKDSGFTILDGALCDEKYRDMSADQIYDSLQQEADKRAKSGKGAGDEFGDMPGVMGQDIQEPGGPDGMTPEAMAKAQRSIQQRVAQAASIARMAGNLSGGLERLVNDILNPKIPWSDLLRDYIKRTNNEDESWSRRNRRFNNMYLPSLYSERMGPIIEILDTSGSISNDELSRYASEGAAIIEDVKPESIRLVWADTRVAGEQLFEDGEPVVPEPKGGGGTDMRVPLKHVEQYDPEIVVLFTDGYTPWPDVEPPYPLIVVCTTDVAVPIGIVVRV